MLNEVSSHSETTTGLSRSFARSAIPFLVLILGVVAISFTAIFIKFALNEISVEGILFDRLLIGTIAFASWNWGSQLWKSKIAQDRNDILRTEKDSHSAKEADRPTQIILIGLILLLVVTHLTGRFVYMLALQQTTAVNAVTLSNLTPIFTFLAAWLFMGKKFDISFSFGLAIAVGGGVFLTLEDWLNLDNQLFETRAILGDLLALLCAGIYALDMLLTEQLLKHLPKITFLTWHSAISLALVAPFLWIQGDSILPITSTGWLAILGLGFICQVIGHGLIAYSFQHFSSAFVTIVFLLEPFLVAFFAWIVLGEFLSGFNIMGFFLISIGIYLAQIGKGSHSMISANGEQ